MHPVAWKVDEGEDPRIGVPIDVLRHGRRRGAAEALDDADGKATILRRSSARSSQRRRRGPLEHGRTLTGVRGLQLHVDHVRAKLKYGGNVDDAHGPWSGAAWRTATVRATRPRSPTCAAATLTPERAFARTHVHGSGLADDVGRGLVRAQAAPHRVPQPVVLRPLTERHLADELGLDVHRRPRDRTRQLAGER